MYDRWLVAASVSLTLLAAGVVFLAATGPAAAAPETVDGCTTIEEPGSYVLTSDIDATRERCIEVAADDVVLDGDDHLVSGEAEPATAGVFSIGTNVTVRNLRVAEWDYGVIVTGDDSTVSGVTGRSLESSVATAAEGSSMELRDIDGRDVGEASAFVDNATEVTVSSITGEAVGDAIVLVRTGGGVDVDDVSGSGADRGGVTVERSAEVSIDRVRAHDSTLGVSVVTTNGATVTDVSTRDTHSGVYLAYNRDVTLEGASIQAPDFDGVVARNLTDSRLRDVEVSDAGDDGVQIYGSESLLVRNVSTTPTDVGIAVLESGSVRLEEVAVANGTRGAVVRSSSGTTVDGLDVRGVVESGVEVNGSTGTTVGALTAEGVATGIDVRGADDVSATGGALADVEYVVVSDGGSDVAIADLALEHRRVSVAGDAFAVAVVDEPPDAGDRVVVRPVLEFTDVTGPPVDLTVDLYTDESFDTDGIGLYRYDDGWERLSDDVDGDVPSVSATVSDHGVVAVLTTGSRPSYASPTPTVTGTPTADADGTETEADGTSRADGTGFTPLLVIIVIGSVAAAVRRRLGWSG